MKYEYHHFPAYTERRVSICDSLIYRIDLEPECVRFRFINGLFILNDCQNTTLKDGYIEIRNCSAEEFSCVYFKRQVGEAGALLNGTPISLLDVAQHLQRTDAKLEVYLELYDFNYLYWRCAVVPNQTSGLTDRLDIEVAGEFPVTYLLV